MMKRVGIGLCVFSLWAAQAAWAGLYEKGGAHGVGARAMGLAGACSAIPGDENASWWNPAGLSDVDTLRLGTSLGSQYNDHMRSANFSAAFPLPAGAAGGFSWQHDYYARSAEINTDALVLAGSLPLSDDRRLNLGVGLKLLFGGIHKTGAAYSGLGLDGGIHYRLELPARQSLMLGARIQDLDTRLKWNHGAEEQVPASLALGGAWNIRPGTMISLDLESIQTGPDPDQGSQMLRLGAEQWLHEMLGVRAGWILDSRQASTFALGAGCRYAGWELQYAFLGMVSNLGLSHRVSLSYGLPAISVTKSEMVALKPAPTPAVTPAATPVATPAPTPATVFQARGYSLKFPPQPVFSPNGDGVADTVLFRGNVTQGDLPGVSAWRLELENQEGQVVRSFAGSGATIPIEWDGRDNRGNGCADGSYVARWHFLDERGGSAGTAETTVAIRTVLTGYDLQVAPSLFMLIGGRPEKPLRFEKLAANPVPESRWQLIILNAKGASVKKFQGKGLAPAIIPWNGQLASRAYLPDGEYLAVMDVQDSVGLLATMEAKFAVVKIDPEASLEIAPRLLRPGERPGGEALIRLYAQPRERVASWRLEIRDALSGKLVRTYARSSELPESITWDTTDNQGNQVRNGAYFLAQLQVRFANNVRVKSPAVALATDIGSGSARRALALHLSTIMFPSGSGTIPLEAYKQIRQAAETVKKYAKQYQVHIKGYTDSQEVPGRQFELSWERAMKVRDYLQAACGIPEEKLELAGYGDSLPLAPEDQAAGRAKNRRVEIVLIIEK